MGVWRFSYRLDGTRDWHVQTPVGPLGQRIGSAPRRQQIVAGLSELRAEPYGPTALHDSVLAAFRAMRRTHRPELVNSVIVFTDSGSAHPRRWSSRVSVVHQNVGARWYC
jgi:hypothetical protein